MKMGLKLLAGLLFLVVLFSGTSSSRLWKREAQEKEVLAQIQEAAQGYWEQVSSTTQNWLEQVKSLGVNEKLSDMYEKSYSAVGTYASIISDQMYHWWHGDQ